MVHIASGFSGLMAAIMVGPRKNNSLGLHSLPMMMMGTCMLWVGWMGFNAGSALTASAAAASALVNTQVRSPVGCALFYCDFPTGFYCDFPRDFCESNLTRPSLLLTAALANSKIEDAHVVFCTIVCKQWPDVPPCY